MRLSWRKRTAFLAIIGLISLGASVPVWYRAHPRSEPQPLGTERRASTAILPAALQARVDADLDPYRTRDFTWFKARYGGQDPVPFFPVFNQQSWSSSGIVMHDGVWVSEVPPDPKPLTEIWVGAFGASSVEGGFGFDARGRGHWNAWPPDLEEQLRRAGHPVRVFNYGFPGISSGDAVWRFETEAIPTGIDVALFYVEHNDAVHCSRQFSAVTLAALDDYMRTGDERILRRLGAWFHRHRGDWARIRKQTDRELASALDRAERALRDRLSSAHEAGPALRDALARDPALAVVPALVIEHLDEVQAVFRDHRTLRSWVASHPRLRAGLEIQLETIRREDEGRRLAADPRAALAHDSHGMDVAAVHANLLYSLGREPELARESETIRNLEHAIEAARRAGIAVGIIAIPTGYRFHSMDRGICAEFVLTGESVEAYVEGALNPWEQQLARREHLPYVDLQAVLHRQPDSKRLFNDLVHLTYEGKSVAVREAILPLALETLDHVETPRRPQLPRTRL